MIGYCFLGSVPAANHKRLKTEGGKKVQYVGTFSPVIYYDPSSCLKATENLSVFFAHDALKFTEKPELRVAKYHISLCML